MATPDETLGKERRFSFASQAVPAGTFAVVDLQGVEAISRPYEFTLTLVSERADLDLDELLAKPATLTIHSRVPGQPAVPYHGVLTEGAQLQQVANGWTLYRATLAPRMQRLSLHHHSEVYLNTDVPHVIDTILKHAQFLPADYEFRLARKDYFVVPYLCQFEETYLDFIHRWMEWRGIYYFFEQGQDREKLVFADTRTIHQAARGAVSYRPAEQLDTGTHDEFVQAFICIQKPVPRKLGLKEYDYATAALERIGEAEVSPQGHGEVWLYGEHWSNPEWAAKLAEIRAQELACRARVFHGESTATGLKAGYLLDLAGHYRSDFNGQYLITDVRHEGSQAGTLLTGLDGSAVAAFSSREDSYRTTFTAMPAAMQFRPERITPKPRMNGFVNAFVDAEGSGDYAEIDDRGRYKVQVPFDKTDKAAGKGSFWIRKASQYSGKDHGLHYPLHKGTEVLLGFENGDPDRPVIMGTVSNSEHPNIVTRDNQTQTLLHTAGGNKMQFEDQFGRQHIQFKTLTAATSLQMGAGPESTAAPGKGKYSAEDGFTFGTEANWNEVVSGNKTAAVVGSNVEAIGGDKTEGVEGDKAETICGKKKVVIGKQADIIKGALAMIPLSSTISSVLPSGKVADAITPTLDHTVYGTDSSTVFGKSTKVVIGIKSDAFIGLTTAPVPGLSTGDLYVCPFGGGHTYVNGAPWTDKYIGMGYVVVGSSLKTETWGGAYSVTAGGAVVISAGVSFLAEATTHAGLMAEQDAVVAALGTTSILAEAGVTINGEGSVGIESLGEVSLNAGGRFAVEAALGTRIDCAGTPLTADAGTVTIEALTALTLSGTALTFNGRVVMLGE